MDIRSAEATGKEYKSRKGKNKAQDQAAVAQCMLNIFVKLRTRMERGEN